MSPENLTLRNIPDDVLAAMERIHEAGHSVWIVGGAIRDSLRDLEAKDWDLATDAPSDLLLTLFPRVAPIGLRHGTIQVLTPVRAIEVTTVPAPGEPGILADLGRRDFTVNAMAWSFPAGVFLDPHGGLRDLHRGLLRGVGDSALRFREDPLRALRAGRFISTCGFRLEEATFEALRREVSGLSRVAPERVRDEWLRLLAGNAVPEGVECMWRGGVIRETIPEMLGGDRGDRPAGDAEQAVRHAARTVHECPAGTTVRLAAYFHNLGVPSSRDAPGPAARGCMADPAGSSGMAEGILQRWRASTRHRREVASLVEHQITADSHDRSGAELRRAMSRVGRDLLRDWIDLAEAHARVLAHDFPELHGQWPDLRRRILAELADGFPMEVRELALKGSDVMQALGIRPGEAVGRVLRALHERAIEDPSLNRRDLLMDFLLKAFHE
jgi:tRNA nucleotidyltransferase/poly(A) polymerase